MRSSYSLLQDIQKKFPKTPLNTYSKASLTALSHAMEDMVLVGADTPLVIANGPQGPFSRQDVQRYQRIVQSTGQIYILETVASDSILTKQPYIQVALSPEVHLTQEWHLIILGEQYSACIICQELAAPILSHPLDSMRQFRGIWSFDREVCWMAARQMLGYLAKIEPQLNDAITLTQNRYGLTKSVDIRGSSEMDRVLEIDARIFTDRLMTYLEASHHKQLQAYRQISAQEEQQRLIHSITNAIRCSLIPEEMLGITISKLGKIFNHCRCLVYRFQKENQHISSVHESVSSQLSELAGSMWSITKHPLFKDELTQGNTVILSDVSQDSGIRLYPDLHQEMDDWGIGACLLIPIPDQESCQGVLEIHQPSPYLWTQQEIEFLEAIATQLGFALLQGEAYENLAQVNAQLVSLEQAQRSIIAIVGHELRTPLSAIQVCLDTLASSSIGLLDYHQEMLAIALMSSDRLKQLIQDFLLLSRLESGAERWIIEPIPALEYIGLVASQFKAEPYADQPIDLILDLPQELPLIEVDGEAFMIVLTKIVDNAFKFTETGQIRVKAEVNPLQIEDEVLMLQITIEDTGVGIEHGQLEKVFEQFFQEEEYMHRQVGGSGLGLSICRQIVSKMGGKLWVVSTGKNQGSQFSFSIPVFDFGKEDIETSRTLISV